MKIKSFKDYVVLNESNNVNYIGLVKAVGGVIAKRGFVGVEQGISPEEKEFALTFKFKKPTDAVKALNAIQKDFTSLVDMSKEVYAGKYEYPLEDETGGRIIFVLENDTANIVKRYPIDVKNIKRINKIIGTLQDIAYAPEDTSYGIKFELKDGSYILVAKNADDNRVGYYAEDDDLIGIYNSLKGVLRYIEQSGVIL